MEIFGKMSYIEITSPNRTIFLSKKTIRERYFQVPIIGLIPWPDVSKINN